MKKEAKDFQRITADRIEEIFRNGSQKRVLLADEVGLGKTIIAKEVIDRVRNLRQEKHDDMFRVVYVCSNINIVHQNTKNLGMRKQLNIGESRLSMQHLVIQEQVKGIKEENGYRADGKYEDGTMPELLIPLTPGTSFSMCNSYGNVNERALIYCMLRAMGYIDNEMDSPAQEFFCDGVKPGSWAYHTGNYANRIQTCGQDYVSKIHAKLSAKSDFIALLNKLKVHLLGEEAISTPKRHILCGLRMIFAQISIDELEPDLVIMDEFQRFSSLIADNTNDPSEQAIITRMFFRTMNDEHAPLILLLSATPYKPYTTLEELNEQNADLHYEDFIKLTNFLLTGTKAEEFRTVWKNYSMQLSQLSQSNFEVLRISKNKAEESMYSAMCRTERLKDSLIDMTHFVREEPISAGDILSYAQMQKILRYCEEQNSKKRMDVKYRNVPMEYVKSAPYLLSFMDKYALKEYIVKTCTKENSVQLPINNRTQQVLLNIESIYRYRSINSNNARLEKLRQVMLDEKSDAACLLWIPTSHPYYSTTEHNVFERNKNFSKTLVFSAWEMVPRMISVMLSYEAERQTIGKYKGGNKDATYTNSVAKERLRTDSEVLTFSNKYLEQLYDSEKYYGQDIANIETSLSQRIETDAVRLGGKIINESTRITVEEVIQVAKWLEANVHEPCEINKRIIKNLVKMAIASPAVVLHRRLNIEETTTIKNVIHELISIFNQRWSVGIMYRLYKNEGEYWEQVLRYCVEGNLQAVIDEYIHMIDETGELKEDIAQTIYESFVGTNTLEIDTTQNFRNFKERKRRMRTHYAFPFTNKKTDEKNVTCAINVRQAFNSPFRPFVLTTTSIGQEGLDFHWYCRKIMHWNIPSNPQDMEQREGRINRYKCLAIRRNIARKYNKIYAWKDMFNEAYNDLSGQYGGLIPYWSIPIEFFEQVEKIERIIPMYPLSIDRERYERMNAVLSLYRLTMGQPRQEELVELIHNILTPEQVDELLFNLSPIKRKT